MGQVNKNFMERVTAQRVQEKYIIESLHIEENLQEIFSLCQTCTEYFYLETGKAPTLDDAGNILTELPPNKTLSDKHVLGLYNEKTTLIGLIDIVEAYPDAKTWFLGLLLVDMKYREKGLGKDFFQVVCKCAYECGAGFIKIGVIADNHGAQVFWPKLGFVKEKQVVMDREDGRRNVIDVMIKRL